MKSITSPTYLFCAYDEKIGFDLTLIEVYFPVEETIQQSHNSVSDEYNF